MGYYKRHIILKIFVIGIIFSGTSAEPTEKPIGLGASLSADIAGETTGGTTGETTGETTGDTTGEATGGTTDEAADTSAGTTGESTGETTGGATDEAASILAETTDETTGETAGETTIEPTENPMVLGASPSGSTEPDEETTTAVVPLENVPGSTTDISLEPKCSSKDEDEDEDEECSCDEPECTSNDDCREGNICAKVKCSGEFPDEDDECRCDELFPNEDHEESDRKKRSPSEGKSKCEKEESGKKCAQNDSENKKCKGDSKCAQNDSEDKKCKGDSNSGGKKKCENAEEGSDCGSKCEEGSGKKCAQDEGSNSENKNCKGDSNSGGKEKCGNAEEGSSCGSKCEEGSGKKCAKKSCGSKLQKGQENNNNGGKKKCKKTIKTCVPKKCYDKCVGKDFHEENALMGGHGRRQGKCRRKGEIFNECGTHEACERTCRHPNGLIHKCPLVCIPKCVCPRHLVRRERDKKCVPLHQCPRRYHPQFPNRGLSGGYGRKCKRPKCRQFPGRKRISMTGGRRRFPGRHRLRISNPGHKKNIRIIYPAGQSKRRTFPGHSRRRLSFPGHNKHRKIYPVTQVKRRRCRGRCRPKIPSPGHKKFLRKMHPVQEHKRFHKGSRRKCATRKCRKFGGGKRPGGRVAHPMAHKHVKPGKGHHGYSRLLISYPKYKPIHRKIHLVRKGKRFHAVSRRRCLGRRCQKFHGRKHPGTRKQFHLSSRPKSANRIIPVILRPHRKDAKKRFHKGFGRKFPRRKHRGGKSARRRFYRVNKRRNTPKRVHYRQLHPFGKKKRKTSLE